MLMSDDDRTICVSRGEEETAKEVEDKRQKKSKNPKMPAKLPRLRRVPHRHLQMEAISS